MATENRPYQGYPFVNPSVTDVPSVDSATASRWADLPRRQIYNLNKKTYKEETALKNEKHVEKEPVEDRLDADDTKVAPVVYIDLPEDGDSEVYHRINDNREDTCPNSSEANEDPKPSQSRSSNASIAPVVYIDLPEANGSGVARANAEPEYVQDTIFYDPFENRSIELLKEDKAPSRDDSIAGSSTSESEPSVRPPRPAPAVPRPARPGNLNLASPSGSSQSSSATPGPSTLPTFLTKEAQVYGRQPSPDDEFSLSPIPVNEFPEPPPAYSEIDTVRRQAPQPTVVVEQPRAQQVSVPPRTQVILPPSQESVGRKFLRCHHCGSRVYTLVIRQTGAITHVMAMMFLLICLFPLTILIYCMDCCKYKNHYCPNCNSLVGYEVPMLCQKMVYVK